MALRKKRRAAAASRFAVSKKSMVCPPVSTARYRYFHFCKRLMEIPGIGPLIATAAVATMGEASAFKSGREFAAYVGLVPKQTGSGGKVRLLGISKRGDTYLRTLFIHGARAASLLAKEPGPWITELKKRRPTGVAIVAMANKLARTTWAIAAHDRKYDKNHVSIRPC
jgi:transposase